MSKLLYDENELLKRIKEGDSEAFSQFYKQYSHILYHNLVKLVKSEAAAEDILHDTFVKIWERREAISIESNIGGYIFRMAQHGAHDFFRKLRKDQMLQDYILEASTGAFDTLEQSIGSPDELSLLSEAVMQLPSQRRAVFTLCKLEGNSYKEVSSKLGMSTSTINDHIVKAMRSIRDYMITRNHHLISLILIAAFLYLKKIVG